MMSNNANKMTDNNHSKQFSVSQSDGDTQSGIKADKKKKQQELVNTSNNSINQHSDAVSTSMVPLSKTTSASEEAGQLEKHKKQKQAKKPAPVHQAASVNNGEDLLKSSMCSLCQAVFAHFPDLLAHHKTVHSSDTNHPFRCRACGRIQTSEAGLTYHQAYICKMVERPHQCNNCLLKFQSEEMVLTHKCSGCPRKKYACELCDHYRTDSSRDLEKHMRIHTNDKCFVCKVCGFSTAWKKNLKEHMVKHLGYKPYVCDLCEYSTSDRHSFRAHKVKHDLRGEVIFGGEYHIKKRKLMNNIIVDSSDDTPGDSGTGDSGRKLECPFPQCVFQTKLEYMMTNHILLHHGGVKQKLGISSLVDITSSNVSERRDNNSEDSGNINGSKIGSSSNTT